MSESFNNFFSGKRVLLTGHTGFKGAWTALWLSQMGADVAGFSLPPEDSRGNLFNILNLQDSIQSHIGDLADFDKLNGIVKSFQPDIILHLAAQPIVHQAFQNPREAYMSNVMGTVNILEAARNCPSARAIVNVTTDKCYHNKEWHWGYRETDELGGKDPYSSSKACSELVAQSYRETYFNDSAQFLACARAGNVIGGGDFGAHRLLPDIVEAIANGQPVVLRNLQSVRPWQHVFDVIRGYLLLAQNLYEQGSHYATAFNFGPKDTEFLTVKDITERFIDLFGFGEYSVDASFAYGNKESRMLRLDSSKAKSELGWSTALTSDQMLEMTVQWYRAQISGTENMHKFSIQQLKLYENILRETSSHSLIKA